MKAVIDSAKLTEFRKRFNLYPVLSVLSALLLAACTSVPQTAVIDVVSNEILIIEDDTVSYEDETVFIEEKVLVEETVFIEEKVFIEEAVFIEEPPVYYPEIFAEYSEYPEAPDESQILAGLWEFVENLSTLIDNRDYDRWKSLLSDEYYARISSRQFLENFSNSPILRSRGITLRSTNDYFVHVVVPARANSRVDEISFICENIVGVFFIDTSRPEPRRLRLYMLRKIGDNWRIVSDT